MRRLVAAVLVIAVALALWSTSREHRVEVPLGRDQLPTVDGSSLTVFYVAHPTDSSPRAEVVETDRTVTITVSVARRCTDNCTDAGVLASITIALSRPLAGRRVVDGSDA
ncbi:hypothetical protein [Nocardioides perillae]|uniref:Uncharacterized protein n=1 Tax=Nocardioides perillae TaxID=1119534 RepID=A0A7Y9UV90_9ACTN|nr:hypothetical protein [Nocardioides perillae]NYG55950.1 hypothetical protein [Nocardioides perillae]